MGRTMELSQELVSLLGAAGLTFATAESCTGGAVSRAVTAVAGCSAVMLGGVVAYHNNVKSKVLGVPEDVIARYGAVSAQVVEKMVTGVSSLLGAHCAVATSGVAGPGGGTAEKPVGTVWVAVKVKDRVVTRLLQLSDKGRSQNIDTTVEMVLAMAVEEIKGACFCDKASV